MGYAYDRSRPEADGSDVVGERLHAAAKRNFGLGQYIVTEGLPILIEDDGSGTAPDVAKVLSTRGSRFDESMPGHGLGLSIVQEIVRIHGGQVRFGRSERLGGFASTVELPGPQNQ